MSVNLLVEEAGVSKGSISTVLGWPDPKQTARLWVGLVAEAALLEYASSRRDHKLRRALAALTRR